MFWASLEPLPSYLLAALLSGRNLGSKTVLQLLASPAASRLALSPGEEKHLLVGEASDSPCNFVLLCAFDAAVPGRAEAGGSPGTVLGT